MTVSILDDPHRNAGLLDWIGTVSGGGHATRVERIGGGAFRASARVQVAGSATGLSEVFLKIDLGSAPQTGYDLHREYALLRRLDGMAVPAPRALGFDEGLQAMAMACLPGMARYDAIGDDAGWRDRVERSFVGALVAVHRLDVAALRLDHIPAGRSAHEAMRADIAFWQQLLMDKVAEPDDVTLFAFAWLRARLPDDKAPAVLVQGDAGPGNFLFDESGVTGLVDWEMAHLGHPLEDVGCILARSLVQPMMTAERLLALYQEASGRRYRREQLIYATVLLMTRFSVPIALALESRTTALDYGLTSAYFRLSQISMLTLIAAAEGIGVDQEHGRNGAAPTLDFELDYLKAMLGDVVRPALADDYSRYRLDGAISLVGYVRRVLEQDRPPRSTLPAGDRLARFADAVSAGPGGMTPILTNLLREVHHRERLMDDMLGPLAGRRVVI